MARITPLLLQFNKSFEYSETPEGLISYLDEHAPQWREIIKDREEWLLLFERQSGCRRLPGINSQLLFSTSLIIEMPSSLYGTMKSVVTNTS